MAKQALEGKRLNAFGVDPDGIVIIGLDTKDGPGHPLYDKRVALPLNEAMVLNIMVHGVLEAVLVRKETTLDGEEIVVCVAGRQRIRCAREANRRLRAEGAEPILVPCMVRRGSDAGVMGVMISENEIRQEDAMESKLNKLERYLATGKTEQDAAIAFGVSTATIKNWLAVLESDPALREAVDAGHLSHTAAANVAKLPRAEQAKVAKEAKNGKPTVEKVKRAVKAAKNGTEANDAPSKRLVTKLLAKQDSEYLLAEGPQFEEGFWAAVKWMRGELSDTKISGLRAAIRSLEEA